MTARSWLDQTEDEVPHFGLFKVFFSLSTLAEFFGERNVKTGVLNLPREIGTCNFSDSPQTLLSATLYRFGKSRCSGLVWANFYNSDDHRLRTVSEGTNTYPWSFPSSGSAERVRKKSLPADSLVWGDSCLAPIVGLTILQFNTIFISQAKNDIHQN